MDSKQAHALGRAMRTLTKAQQDEVFRQMLKIIAAVKTEDYLDEYSTPRYLRAAYILSRLKEDDDE